MFDRLFPILAVAAIAIVLGVVASSCRETPSEPPASKPALVPITTIKSANGKTIDLKNDLGKVIVLDFWATWCAPCQASLPRLQKLSDELSPRGVRFYAVNQAEPAEKAIEFLKKKNVTIPLLMDDDFAVSDSYGVQDLPGTVIIARDGSVYGTFEGSNDATDARFRAALSAAINAK